MADSFASIVPEEIREYLQFFDPVSRRRGDEHFRRGRVIDLAPIERGGLLAFAATVRVAKNYRVELACDPKDGWFGECSCRVVFDCEHVYAAALEALARRERAESGSNAPLSAGDGPAPQERQAESANLGTLRGAVQAALSRQLEPKEIQFLAQFRALYETCCQTRQLTVWQLEDIGLYLPARSWELLRLWPAFPANEIEFWQHIAYALREAGRAIPTFLAPATDLGPIHERMRQWRRGETVKRWAENLAALNLGAAPGTAAPAPADFRIVLDSDHARVQWRRSEAEDFSDLGSGKMSRLAQAHRAGAAVAAREAAVLWVYIEQYYSDSGRTQIGYSESSRLQWLGQALRLPGLESRMVRSGGQPLERPEQPLRWAMTPAANEQDDYHFQLVDAAGERARIQVFFPGDPPLYLTEAGLCVGPAPQPLLSHSGETAIPAPALETSRGLEFLQSFGIEPPPRIRERIRKIPMRPVIECGLRPTYVGSKTEECVVIVTASTGDKREDEVWNGAAWAPKNQFPRGAPANAAGDEIPVLDRSALAEIPALLEPLELKSRCGGELTVRVTKKFPAIFVAWAKSLPPHIAVELKGELATLAEGAVSGKVRLEVQETAIDWFDLKVVLDVSDTTLSPEEIKLLLDARGQFVRLAGKGWRRLQFDLADDDDHRLARLGLNPHELTSEPQRLHALQLADDSAKKFLPEPQMERIQVRAQEIKTRVTPAVPQGIVAQMRPYQIEGFYFLSYLSANRFGGILADDMGLGKTLQTLAWLLWLAENDPPPADGAPKPTPCASLVVCPKSVMDNWQAEAQRFAPALRVKIWRAVELPELSARVAEADLHVLNYSQIRILGETLAGLSWRAAILDEGQYIKNPNSQTAQVARALRAQHRLILSGTPIENRLMDLWSLMAFAMPGVLGSRAHFGRLFDAKGDPLARVRLAARVRPFLLRRTKTQVAQDLPDRVEEDLYCEIDGEQRALYRAELKRAQQLLLKVQTQKQLAKEQFNFLTSLLRLRQICCHPALVNGNSQSESAKVEALLEQLEPLMEEGQKVLVFSQFVQMLELLKPAITARSWPVFYLAGDTENRGDLVADFQACRGPAVFLISLKAGGFGLNLTAASYVVLFDPWWNPAVENQAIDRTHRIGQAQKVIAYRLLIKESIEEKIRALQKQKKELAQDILGEERFAQSLSLQDFQFLFSD